MTPADAEALLAADDDTFAMRWPALSIDERLELPDDIRTAGAERYRRLRPDIGASVARAVRAQATPSERLDVVPASEITPEPVDWLWPGWLAHGKLHVLGGAPGAGKTMIALALAAAVSCGGRWPDGTTAPRGSALVASYEDDPADTLVPRLAAMGADLTRVHILRGVRDTRGRRGFDAARDIGALVELAARIGDLGLVVVDPVVSAIGLVDSHRNLETRQALQPLADFAAASRAAVLALHHLRKASQDAEPLERLIGSIAFGALARVAMIAGRTRDGETERRVLARAKSNIGPDTGGYVYDLVPARAAGVDVYALAWGEAVDGHARELLAQPPTDDDRTERESAEQFLRELLAAGPLPSRQVRAEAAGAGHAWRTVWRAARALGVETYREGGFGGRGEWRWRLQ